MTAFNNLFKTSGDTPEQAGAASDTTATTNQKGGSSDSGTSSDTNPLTEANPDTVTAGELLSTNSMAGLGTRLGEMWQHGFMGIDVGQIVVAIAIFVVFLFLRGLFSKYVLHRLYALTAKSETDIDDKVIAALTPPIRLIPIIIGFFLACQYSALDVVLGATFDQILRTLVVFTLFWGIYRVLGPLSQTLTKLQAALTPIMVTWLFKILSIVTVLIGGAIILEIWGIKIGPLLAGFGLLGAAVALGAQDIFKNLIGGVTVIAEKRFHKGDWIKIDGVVEGVVEDIGIRSTEIRQFDKAPVHVPNAHLSDAVVSNYSRMTHRRIYWLIGLEFRTSVEQLRVIRDGIHSYIENNEDFDKDVSTFVRVDSFADSAINVMVYCFTKTTDWARWLEIREALAVRVKEIVEDEAGAGFAFPSQSLYLEKWPEGGRPEVYVPPESQ
jgi:MscS family membrane protein